MHRPIPPNTPGFARMAQPGELPADLVRQAEAAVRAVQAGGAASTLSERSVNVAVGSLPSGVIAMATRQGSHIMLAYSAQALNDGLFVAVDRLLSDDVAERPEIVGTRTLAVMADYSVKATEGGYEVVLPHRLHIAKQGNGDPITARIFEAVKDQAPAPHPAMGMVRVVREAPDAP